MASTESSPARRGRRPRSARGPAHRRGARERGGDRPPPPGAAARGDRRAGEPAVKTLMLHGFAGTPKAFARFFADAEAPDLPGHGRARDAISWEDALARLELDGPVALFGYSMGARLALAFALRHPAAVTQLILESGTAGIEDAEERARPKTDDDPLADSIDREAMEKFVDRC